MEVSNSVARNKVIHLTITSAYAQSWGTWEGVREFVQNWYDGVLDSYETMSPPLEGPVIKKYLKIVPVSSSDVVISTFVLGL